jgi:predicted flap endonuclease-1-like 5' DNA nuclease
MANIIHIEGVGKVYAERLLKAGIPTTEALLEAGATPKGREALVEKTGIGHMRILRWVNRADLFRVKGIGEQYSDLVAAAGVETVLELAQRVPEHLHRKMAGVNKARRLVRHLPSLEHVTEWVKEAGRLTRVVSY